MPRITAKQFEKAWETMSEGFHDPDSPLFEAIRIECLDGENREPEAGQVDDRLDTLIDDLHRVRQMLRGEPDPGKFNCMMVSRSVLESLRNDLAAGIERDDVPVKRSFLEVVRSLMATTHDDIYTDAPECRDSVGYAQNLGIKIGEALKGYGIK